MNTKWIWCTAILTLLWVGSSSAGSVYFWTDENGVRHYSNTGIPSDIQEADERPEEITPETSAPPPEANVDAEGSENLPDAQEGTPAEEAPEGAGGQEVDGRLAAKIEAERKRLESEIKRIEGLSIGVSFTPGMKEARIRPLKEQLALLNADPERYFRMKREGAFGDAPSSESENTISPLDDSLSDALEPLKPVSSSGSDSRSDSSTEEDAAPAQE